MAGDIGHRAQRHAFQRLDPQTDQVDPVVLAITKLRQHVAIDGDLDADQAGGDFAILDRIAGRITALHDKTAILNLPAQYPGPKALTPAEPPATKVKNIVSGKGVLMHPHPPLHPK